MAQKPINDTENLTIGEILRYNLEERKGSRFNAVGIDKVIIDGNEFTDYGAFSFLREKSYVKSPERSGDGSITNLNSYATFVTPHLKIDFTMMSIDSYRRIMELLYSKNEFVVTCYDIVRNETTTNKMYFATEEMPKLWTIARALNGEEWVELLGVQDYTVEMIGTNASLDKVDILYYDKEGNLLHAQEVDKGTEAIINFTFTPTMGYKFEGEWVTKNGTKWYNGQAQFIKEETELHASVQNDNIYTLSFNYGKGVEPIQSSNSQPVTTVKINYAQPIGSAISQEAIQTTEGIFAFPENGTGLNEVKYEYDGKEEVVNGDQVYTFSGWYWTSEENIGTKVTSTTFYMYSVNRTIYQIYKAIPHTLTYDTGTDEITLDPQSLGYEETVILPKLARKGYNFKGWFLQSGNGAPTIMPPKDMTVYAKWEQIK